MGRVVVLVLAALMVVAGGLWTLQGLGYVGGSPMSGQRVWSVVGPALAGLGVALAIVVLRPRP